MQTFLPYPDFAQSARALDNKRLNKQRIEVKQILRALSGEKQGWRNHPATKMWYGYEWWLAAYGQAICSEWLERGYKDSLLGYFQDYMTGHYASNHGQPSWLGDMNFHRSHQSNLIRKLPTHYGPLFPGVPNNLPYVWPTP